MALVLIITSTIIILVSTIIILVSALSDSCCNYRYYDSRDSTFYNHFFSYNNYNVVVSGMSMPGRRVCGKNLVECVCEFLNFWC